MDLILIGIGWDLPLTTAFDWICNLCKKRSVKEWNRYI